MIEQPAQYSQRIAVALDDLHSLALALRRQSFCWIVTHSRLRSPNAIVTPTSPECRAGFGLVLGRNRRPNRQEGSDSADEGNWFSFTVFVDAVGCNKHPRGLSM